MEKLYALAKSLNLRFPEGNTPFQIATRLLEECGELASEINHFENTGVKALKHGPPSRESLAHELRNVLTAVLQVALYYGVEDELSHEIDSSYARNCAAGHIPDPTQPSRGDE